MKYKLNLKAWDSLRDNTRKHVDHQLMKSVQEKISSEVDLYVAMCVWDIVAESIHQSVRNVVADKIHDYENKDRNYN